MTKHISFSDIEVYYNQASVWTPCGIVPYEGINITVSQFIQHLSLVSESQCC